MFIVHITECFPKSKAQSPSQTTGGTCRFSRNVATGIREDFCLGWGFSEAEKFCLQTLRFHSRYHGYFLCFAVGFAGFPERYYA